MTVLLAQWTVERGRPLPGWQAGDPLLKVSAREAERLRETVRAQLDLMAEEHLGDVGGDPLRRVLRQSIEQRMLEGVDELLARPGRGAGGHLGRTLARRGVAELVERAWNSVAADALLVAAQADTGEQLWQALGRYERGEVTYQHLGNQARALIKRSHQEAYKLGKLAARLRAAKGPVDWKRLKMPTLNQRDRQRVDREVASQRQYLRGMLDEARRLKAAGEPFGAKLQWRAGLYGNSCYASFNRGFLAATPAGQKLWWHLHEEAEHCRQCPVLEFNSPYTRATLPTVPRAGDTECLMNCCCTLETTAPRKVGTAEVARAFTERALAGKPKRVKQVWEARPPATTAQAARQFQTWVLTGGKKVRKADLLKAEAAQRKPLRWVTIKGKRVAITPPIPKPVPFGENTPPEGEIVVWMKREEERCADFLEGASAVALGSSSRLKEYVMKRLAEKLAGNPDWEALVSGEVGRRLNLSDWSNDQSENCVASFIYAWANASCDASCESRALQAAAEEEFGIKHPFWPKVPAASFVLTSEWAAALREQQKLGLRAFVRAMYEDTQAALSEAGIEHLLVYRGMTVFNNEEDFPGLELTEELSVKPRMARLQPLSSFSFEFHHAADFTVHKRRSVMLMAEVPRERVLSLPSSGFGCYGEGEIVLLGGDLSCLVGTWRWDNQLERDDIRWAFAHSLAEEQAKPVAKAGLLKFGEAERVLRWVTVAGKKIPITAAQGEQAAGKPETVPTSPAVQALSTADKPPSDARLWQWWADQTMRVHVPLPQGGPNPEAFARQLKANVAARIATKLQGDPDWETLLKDVGMGQGGPMADKLIRSWVRTSGDSDVVALSLQLAARDEFDLSNVATDHFSQTTVKEAGNFLQRNGEGIRKFLRAQYDDTQAYLKEKGIVEVWCARGADLPDVKATGNFVPAQEQLQPMSSFTSEPQTALRFAQNVEHPAIMFAHVPRERILSVPRTGFGCWAEHEVVVLGGQTSCWVWAPADALMPPDEVFFEALRGWLGPKGNE